MAILTWQNVTAPDFSASQSGIRTAGDFFNRAVQNGEDIISGLKAAEAVKKAEAQANADRLLTQQYLTAPDAQSVSQMLARGIDKNADGTQLVNPAQVSPEMMRQYDARRQQLQASALAEQQRLAAENARKTSYAAGQIFDKYAPLATKDPTQALQLAQQELGALNLPVNDARAIMKDLHSLYRDPATLMRAQAERRAVGLREQELQLDRNAAGLADELRTRGDVGAFRKRFFKEPDPLVRKKAFDMLRAQDPLVAERLNVSAGLGMDRADAEMAARLSGVSAGVPASKGRKGSSASSPVGSFVPPPPELQLAGSADVYGVAEKIDSALKSAQVAGTATPEQAEFAGILKKAEENSDDVKTVVRKYAEQYRKDHKAGADQVNEQELQSHLQKIIDGSNNKVNPAAALDAYLKMLEPDSWYSGADAIPGRDIPGASEDDALAKKGSALADYAAGAYAGIEKSSKTAEKVTELLKRYQGLESKVRQDRAILALPPGAQASGLASGAPKRERQLAQLREEILAAGRGESASP